MGSQDFTSGRSSLAGFDKVQDTVRNRVRRLEVYRARSLSRIEVLHEESLKMSISAAASGTRLYSIPTALISDLDPGEEDLAAGASDEGDRGMCDGLARAA